MAYDDLVGKQVLFTTIEPRGIQGYESGTYGPISALLPHFEANFEDYSGAKNYSNALVGKHNQDGTGGWLYNQDYRNRITARLSPLFRPFKVGGFLPARALRGRYQYKNAEPFKPVEVVNDGGERETILASYLSSSAYAYNSELKFNKYISYEAEEQEESNASGLEGLDTSSPAFTDVTYSSSSTIEAFSAYDRLFGADSNTSSTSAGGENYTTTPSPT